MEKPLVSVILPTYKVEKYLPKCLNSLLNQTYDNIEIIVVIDGSPDASKQIAEEFAFKDKRISVVWQENAGSGPARNNGLEHSKGEFIAFIDPDDWVDEDYIEHLIKCEISGAFDLVIVGHKKCVFDGDFLVSTYNNRFSENKVYKNLEEVRNHYLDLRFKSKLDDTPWGKLYRRDIIDKYNLRFPDLRRSQDIYFNTLYYNHINTLCESTYSGYSYREILGDRSIKKTDYYLTAEILYKQLVEMFEEWGMQLDEKLVLSVFALNIIAVYERILLRGESLSPFLENRFVQLVAQKGCPSSLIHRIELLLMRHKLHALTKVIMKLKYQAKKH